MSTAHRQGHGDAARGVRATWAWPTGVLFEALRSDERRAGWDSPRQRLRGYITATPDTIEQGFLCTAGDVTVWDKRATNRSLESLVVRRPALARPGSPTVEHGGS